MKIEKQKTFISKHVSRVTHIRWMEIRLKENNWSLKVSLTWRQVLIMKIPTRKKEFI